MSTTFGDLEFLLSEPNRIEDLAEDWKFFAQRIDFKVGEISIDKHAPSPGVVRQYSWLLDGRKEIKDFREFINRRVGQQVPFWMPTWQRDFTLFEGFEAWQTKLKVFPANYSTTYSGSKSRQSIIFLKHDGSYIIRNILGYSWPVPSYEQIVLDDNIGENHDPKDFSMVCFLVLVRLASDEIQWTWESSTCVTASVKLAELYQNCVEVI